MKAASLPFTSGTRILLGLLILLNLGTARIRADYDGLLIGATAQSPIGIGEPLDITVVVRNTGSFPWIGLELPAWVVQLDEPSWAAGWPVLNYAAWSDVNVDEEVTVVATLDPAELPSSPGNYSVRLVAAYNEYDFDLILMPGSPVTVHFTISSGNRPPTIDPIGNKMVVEEQRLAFQVTATDPDSPAQQLTFSLDPGAPAGATINATNGMFTWTPPPGHQPQTNSVTVRVTDNGSPPADATAGFEVVVIPRPRFEPLARPTNGVITLRWRSYPGETYRLQYTDQLLSNPWLNLGNDIIAASPVTSATDSTGNAPHRCYQVLLLRGGP